MVISLYLWYIQNGAPKLLLMAQPLKHPQSESEPRQANLAHVMMTLGNPGLGPILGFQRSMGSVTRLQTARPYAYSVIALNQYSPDDATNHMT